MTGSQTDRDLVRLYWPANLRSAFDALFAIDDAMADVVANATQPALAAIKLAWWRDALTALDSASPPGEPRLQAAARELMSRGISGAELAGLEDGWLTLVEERPDAQRLRRRGEILFGLAAGLLGCAPEPVADAGRFWAAVDVARRLGHSLPPPVPLPPAAKRLRPLTGLAALARRDAAKGGAPEPEATPARAWVLLRHRLTGR